MKVRFIRRKKDCVSFKLTGQCRTAQRYGRRVCIGTPHKKRKRKKEKENEKKKTKQIKEKKEKEN